MIPDSVEMQDMYVRFPFAIVGIIVVKSMREVYVFFQIYKSFCKNGFVGNMKKRRQSHKQKTDGEIRKTQTEDRRHDGRILPEFFHRRNNRKATDIPSIFFLLRVFCFCLL